MPYVQARSPSSQPSWIHHPGGIRRADRHHRTSGPQSRVHSGRRCTACPPHGVTRAAPRGPHCRTAGALLHDKDKDSLQRFCGCTSTCRRAFNILTGTPTVRALMPENGPRPVPDDQLPFGQEDYVDQDQSELSCGQALAPLLPDGCHAERPGDPLRGA
jgi:hypothetical protein